MKRIISAALLLMMLLAFTACDKAQTSQNPSQSATESSEQTMAATATPTIEITQAPTATVTPTLEITKKPIVTNNSNSDTATRDPNWQPATFPPEMTKADYDFDFGITYIIDDIDVLCGPNTVEIWKNNDGDSSQLEQAIKAIQNMDFRFSEDYDTTRPYDPSNPIACAHKEVEQRVKETIKDYKAYLDTVILGGNRYYYSGCRIGPGSIYLISGDKAALIMVERVIFGCDPVPTPTVKPTATPVPNASDKIKDVVVDKREGHGFRWIHTEGAGNSKDLAEAVRRIEQSQLKSPVDVKTWPSFPNWKQKSTVAEAINNHLLKIFWDLDVYVDEIAVFGGPIGDYWDEDGNRTGIYDIEAQCIYVRVYLYAGGEKTSVEIELK